MRQRAGYRTMSCNAFTSVHSTSFRNEVITPAPQLIKQSDFTVRAILRHTEDLLSSQLYSYLWALSAVSLTAKWREMHCSKITENWFLWLSWFLPSFSHINLPFTYHALPLAQRSWSMLQQFGNYFKLVFCYKREECSAWGTGKDWATFSSPSMSLMIYS